MRAPIQPAGQKRLGCKACLGVWPAVPAAAWRGLRQSSEDIPALPSSQVFPRGSPPALCLAIGGRGATQHSIGLNMTPDPRTVNPAPAAGGRFCNWAVTVSASSLALRLSRTASSVITTPAPARASAPGRYRRRPAPDQWLPGHRATPGSTQAASPGRRAPGRWPARQQQPAPGGRTPHSSHFALPYLGLGYTSLSARDGWGFSADIGLGGLPPR